MFTEKFSGYKLIEREKAASKQSLQRTESTYEFRLKASFSKLVNTHFSTEHRSDQQNLIIWQTLSGCILDSLRSVLVLKPSENRLTNLFQWPRQELKPANPVDWIHSARLMRASSVHKLSVQ